MHPISASNDKPGKEILEILRDPLGYTSGNPRRVSTHVKFWFPPPLLGTHWCKVLSRDESRVEEGFHRVIKDQIHFALARNEGVEDRRVCEESDGRSDDELPGRDEWWKGGDCSEMRRLEVKGDLLESLPVLNTRPSVGKRPQEQWGVQRSRPAIRRPRHTSLPVRRSDPGESGDSSSGS